MSRFSEDIQYVCILQSTKIALISLLWKAAVTLTFFCFRLCNLNSKKETHHNCSSTTLRLDQVQLISRWTCSLVPVWVYSEHAQYKLGRLLLCCSCLWDCIFERGRLDGTASVCWEKLFSCCQLNLRICCRGQETLRMFISTEAESIYL